MTENIGRGLFGSLRAHVRIEVNDLARRNKTLRRSFRVTSAVAYRRCERNQTLRALRILRGFKCDLRCR
jgi:hypothetical protein